MAADNKSITYTMPIDVLGSRKDSKTKRKSSKMKSMDFLKIDENDVPEPEPIPTTRKVFLYVHLKEIMNLPSTGNRLIMKLTHKESKISKLEDHYSEDNDIVITDLNNATTMPCFSITIEQDSIEDLNSLSDNPLIVTVYEEIPPRLKGEEDTSEGELQEPELPIMEPIAQGCIDLLQCFSKKRCLTGYSTYLYPIVSMRSSILLPTIKTLWHMYTLLPLLRDVLFCNIAFITFESIYNAPTDIMDNHEGLMADLYFQSKIPNAKKQFDKVKLSSYSLFTRKIIAEQNANIKWENLKDGSINANHLGLYTGAKVSVHKLFEHLMCTEDTKFNFRNIVEQEDEALVCNSVHRHILTKEISIILEELVAFNRQHLLVQVYKSEHPERILMQGNLDLSVLLYPRVNACRFAVKLQPTKQKSKNKKHQPPSGADKRKEHPPSAASTTVSTDAANGDTNSRRSKDITSPIEETPFAIIAICLLSPISEGDDQFSIYNDSHLTREKLKLCLKINREMKLLPMSQIAEDNYKSFDELIGKLIEYIITFNIKNTDDAKAYFCCQLGNLSTKIISLIATDFNKRFPTNTNLEFTKLMSTVYKELTERIYRMLLNCNNINLELCFVSDFENLSKIISVMDISKYMYEVGDVEIADFLFDKIWFDKNNTNIAELHFYKFLYDTELQNFGEAKEYIRRPKKKWLAVDYFVEWVRLYINYMETLEYEQTYNQALENLLIELQDFIEKYPNDIEGLILMHCLYRKYIYLPGVSFTRWKYEDLFEKPHRRLPTIPKSRWEFYNNYILHFHTDRGYHFYEVVKLFSELGMYKFAEIIFKEIAKDCLEVERYLMTTTFKVLLKEVDKKTTVKWFEMEEANAVELIAFQAQVNGNLYYLEGVTDEAMQNYENILNLDGVQNYENFELSLMRYGYAMLEQHEYYRALRAFDKCFMGENGLVAYIIKGKTLYRANYLEEAEKLFAKCTTFKIHIPNVWGYLALINLRLGNNFKALEFWKYAKINPDNVISEEILQELQKIQYKDVFLYVDKPL